MAGSNGQSGKYALTEFDVSQRSDDAIEHASQPFIGRWTHLVSTTNWEKGRIIAQWRETLADADAPASEYSDEAWSRRVGGVTGQHVGRLRRVYQRFGATHEQYEGLYWSHFQAALEWDDAEMWLEGARLSRWSVAQMRHQRWEAMGATVESQPRDEDEILSEWDEDFESAQDRAPESGISGAYDAGTYAEVTGAGESSGSAKDNQRVDKSSGTSSPAGADEDDEPGATPSGAERAAQVVRPFESVGDLPDDLSNALDLFKLAILRHKSEEWRAVQRDQVLAAIDGLRELVLGQS